MKTPDAARELARSLVRVARGSGLPAVALVTDMQVPIGLSIGNAVETREAIEVLQGSGPEDTRELTILLAEAMLHLAGVKRARSRLERALRSGEALDRFARMVAAHGGDARVTEDVLRLPQAPKHLPVPAPAAGTVQDVDAYQLALVAMALGAGRTRADQDVDPAVGIVLAKKPGMRVKPGEPLAWLHLRTIRGAAAHVADAARAFTIGRGEPEPRRLLLDRIEA
jgi:thymidine phosphorylase